MIRGITVPCARCGQPVTEFDGTSLRETRISLGLSLRELARRLCISPTYLSDIERGHRRCPAKIAAAYETLANDARWAVAEATLRAAAKESEHE